MCGAGAGAGKTQFFIFLSWAPHLGHSSAGAPGAVAMGSVDVAGGSDVRRLLLQEGGNIVLGAGER